MLSLEEAAKKVKGAFAIPPNELIERAMLYLAKNQLLIYHFGGPTVCFMLISEPKWIKMDLFMAFSSIIKGNVVI